MGHVELVKKLELDHSTLNTAMQNRSLIMEAYEKFVNSKLMRMKQSTYDEMEQVLLT